MPAESGSMVFAQPIGGHDIELATAMSGPWSTAAPEINDDLRMTFPAVAGSWSRWSPADLDAADKPGKIDWTPRTPDGATALPRDIEGILADLLDHGRQGPGGPSRWLPITVEKHSGRTVTAGELVAREARAGVTKLQFLEALGLITRIDHETNPEVVVTDRANLAELRLPSFRWRRSPSILSPPG